MPVLRKFRLPCQTIPTLKPSLPRRARQAATRAGSADKERHAFVGVVSGVMLENVRQAHHVDPTNGPARLSSVDDRRTAFSTPGIVCKERVQDWNCSTMPRGYRAWPGGRQSSRTGYGRRYRNRTGSPATRSATSLPSRADAVGAREVTSRYRAFESQSVLVFLPSLLPTPVNEAPGAKRCRALLIVSARAAELSSSSAKTSSYRPSRLRAAAR